MADPVGRVNIAFDQPTLLWDVEWTRIDSYPHLVTSYSIDRGRQYELDRTDTGRATVQIADSQGILDPTNADGPYYGLIEPLLQIALSRWNPVTEQWYLRYRGFIEEMDYTFDPSQQVNRLQLACVDLFEILSAIQMTPGADGAVLFGDDPAVVAPDSNGQIVFANESMQSRVEGVLGDAGIPDDWFVVFTGNVELATSTYAPTENVMTVIQEACDAEFPAVSNAYCEGTTGRLAVHGRQAKFHPAETALSAGDAAWDWHHWHVGDGAAVNAGSGLAHIRQFAYNRGLSRIINHAYASPVYEIIDGAQVQTNGDVWALADNDGSKELYGLRSWSAENLLTLRGWDPSSDGAVPGTTALDEVSRFVLYYIANYNSPQYRVTVCGFRTMSPDQPHAAATWDLLSRIEIADLIDITVGSPGGGGFTDESFFVEGIHEQVQPLGAGYDDVTLTLDLSPQAYFRNLTMFESDDG